MNCMRVLRACHFYFCFKYFQIYVRFWALRMSSPWWWQKIKLKWIPATLSLSWSSVYGKARRETQNKARPGNNWNQIGPTHSIVFPRNHTDLPFATFDHHQKVINNIWKREIVPTENVFSKKEYNEYRGYFDNTCSGFDSVFGMHRT